MDYFGRTPPPPLDAFVERVWCCSQGPPRTNERVLPGRERVVPGGGTMDLVVNLAEDEIRMYAPEDAGRSRTHSGSLVSGVSTRSFLVDPRQRTSVVGVHFRPGGAFPFLGISPAEIVDSHVGLGDLWGSGGRCLREQLLEARSPGERLRRVEAALLRRWRRSRPGHPAVRAAVAALHGGGNEVRVAEVAAMVGLSHRRFIEVFEREVGLTPKLYARLQRFHRVKRCIARLEGPPAWAGLALDCGYFDQSHMIRDFIEFSGMSPASYLQSRAEETMFDQMVHAYPRQHRVSGRKRGEHDDGDGRVLTARDASG